MNQRNIILVVVFALLMAEFGIALRQYKEIRDLKASVPGIPRAALQAAANKANKLRQAIDLLQNRQGAQTTGATRRGDVIGRFQAAIRDPKFVRQMEPAQRRMIQDTYDRLFKVLNLPPETEAAFIDLLEKKQIAKTDAASALMDNGLALSGLTAVSISEAQNAINEQIQQVLGAADYKQYYNFETTESMRLTLGRLQDALRYTSTPLSGSGVESIIATLNNAAPTGNSTAPLAFTGASAATATGLANLNPGATLPSTAPELLASQLSEPQLQQLKVLMSQQNDERQLRAAMLKVARASEAP